MTQYTVYALYPDALGVEATAGDMARYNEIVAEEIEDAGLAGEARVLVTPDAGRYTLAPSAATPSGIGGMNGESLLSRVLAVAWERFLVEWFTAHAESME